jgi:citrate synthase
MSGTKTPEEIFAEAKAWWTTEIIDIHPGEIGIRGYAIQDLIGKVSFPQMIWLMLRGDLPSPPEARLLEACLVASVDHGPHAPSIAIARMAATTGVALNNVMASAVNVLGDVHGGAGQQCMELLETIKADPKSQTDLPGAVDDALSAFVAAKGKIIPGFGHRWHKIDPRCAPVLALVEEARAGGDVGGVYVRIGREIEAGIKRRTGKDIPMNIDGVTAVAFCELGFAAPLGRGLFVLARSVGILSHAWEEIAKGSRMKGPMPKSIPYRYAGKPPRKPV